MLLIGLGLFFIFVWLIWFSVYFILLNLSNMVLSFGVIEIVVLRFVDGVRVICRLIVFFLSFGINLVFSFGSIIVVIISNNFVIVKMLCLVCNVFCKVCW